MKIIFVKARSETITTTKLYGFSTYYWCRCSKKL